MRRVTMSDIKKVFGVGIIGCSMIGQKKAKALGMVVLASKKGSLREVGNEMGEIHRPLVPERLG